MKELWHLLQGNRRRFVTIVSAEAAVGGVEALVHPLLLKAIFDQGISGGNFRTFVALGVSYLVFGVVLNLTAYGIACWRRRFENALVLALELEMLDSALDADSRQLSKAGNASYLSRVHDDIHEGVLPSIDTTVLIARQGLASSVFLGVLLFLSWQASLVLLVIVPPLVFVSRRIARGIEQNTEPEREAEAQYVSHLSRTLEAFHAVRGLPLLRPGTRALNGAALRTFLDIRFVTFRLGMRQRTVSDLVMNVSDTASMIVGAFFVFAGKLTFGGFLAFVNSLWRAVTGIFGLINLIPQLRRNRAVLRRISSLRDAHVLPYYASAAGVHVEGVRVEYDDDTVITIDGFYVQPGERVLLRGSNGCGKTTLLHVVAGTLAPDAGAVARPARVASLTAPVLLPPLTVGELVPDARLRVALELTGLVDQRPAELSSGQRQRVGVAALLSEDADLYIVDEPFANLDSDGTALVTRALDEGTRGRSLLVVHHGDEHLDREYDRVVTLAADAEVHAVAAVS